MIINMQLYFLYRFTHRNISSVYSYEVMEKLLILFENKNLQHRNIETQYQWLRKKTSKQAP